jgi:hypothetical protein
MLMSLYWMRARGDLGKEIQLPEVEVIFSHDGLGRHCCRRPVGAELGLHPAVRWRFGQGYPLKSASVD